MKTNLLKLLILILALQAYYLYSEIQWASYVLGYSSELGTRQYSIEQALGEPSVLPEIGFSPCAWAPRYIKNKDGEYIHLGFSKPQQVQTIIVNLNNSPDCIDRIYLFDIQGSKYLVYNKITYETRLIKGTLFKELIERTSYKVKSILIYFKTQYLTDFLQVDAVGISEDDERNYTIRINEVVVPQIEISEPINLGPNVNSPYRELAPVVTPNGERLYFTREEHPANFGSLKKQDIWYSEIKGDSNLPAVILPSPINNENHNFVFGTTPDGMSLIIGNVYNPDGTMRKGVSIAKFNGYDWDFPKEIIIRDFENLNDKTAYFLAMNGRILISSIEGRDSYGGLDLYVSFLQEDGTFSKPMNLGPNVNTADDDTSPFLAYDDETLYFASAGHPGYGSLDIFMSRRLDSTWTKWTKPINLGKIVNTESWDAYFTIPASGNYAYFVSTKNSLGKEDIFRVFLPKSLRPKPVVIVYGKVLNKKTNQPVKAKIQYEHLSTGKVVGVTESNPLTGEYKIVLPGGSHYGFLAQADSFMSINENIDISLDIRYQEIKRDLFLVPIEVGESIRLNNIFFEYNDYKLKEESFPELNRIAKLLKERQEIVVEISGHTDNIGSPAYNNNLSLQRAKTVAEYLISQGISPERIRVKGYGEKYPVESNDTEEGRQKNRRVEFKILKK
jgi:outer membrane protein OmpA-like peptidoglycan-associated protein/mRNA-degrading endonuclease HigB of HigAB toxin-antitoxin module